MTDFNPDLVPVTVTSPDGSVRRVPFGDVVRAFPNFDHSAIAIRVIAFEAPAVLRVTPDHPASAVAALGDHTIRIAA